MQENRTTILSTRPVEPEWVTMAAGKGLVLEAVSFIETHPILPDEAVMLRMAALYRRSLAVVFTSMNAVDAVAAWTDKFRNEDKTGPDWRIFCIGQATLQRVIRYFGEDAVAGTANSALALAETILTALKKEMDDPRGPQIFFFCGDQRRNELPDRLRENSVKVTEVVVYNTVRTARRIEKRYNGILFFSPSAVDSFFSTNSVDEETVLFAIGATTAAAIGNHSRNRVVLSDSPAKEKLIVQAIAFFTNAQGQPSI